MIVSKVLNFARYQSFFESVRARVRAWPTVFCISRLSWPAQAKWRFKILATYIEGKRAIPRTTFASRLVTAANKRTGQANSKSRCVMPTSSSLRDGQHTIRWRVVQTFPGAIALLGRLKADMSLLADSMNSRLNGQIHSLELKADRLFINSGFSTVAYDVAATDRMFGSGGYTLDQKIHMNAECIALQGALFQEAQQKLQAVTLQGDASDDESWGLVCSDKRLLSEHKLRIMQRWFPEKYRNLMLVELPFLLEAQDSEKAAICQMYPSPGIGLGMLDSLPVRKAVFNNVFSDAFGAMGFKKKRFSRGVVVLKKQLSARLEVVVETDSLLLMRSPVARIVSNELESQLARIPRFSGMPLDYLTYLSTSGSDAPMRLMTFTFSGFSFARNLCRRYVDSSSLEVALRAHALWYRSMVMPFEEVLAEAWAL